MLIRKNSLFAKSITGAHANAIFWTLAAHNPILIQ
ncbi:hypothetical protein H5R88_08590 [Limosilactobacillus sp. WF-MT5-A]|nr:hypothetical protein [Limosilactobacillus agrestis]